MKPSEDVLEVAPVQVILFIEEKSISSKTYEPHKFDVSYNVSIKESIVLKRNKVNVAKKSKSVIRGDKFTNNVYTFSLDKASFNSEESVLKWKYVFHESIALEREL